MNPGVCINPYSPHGYLAPIPPGLAYVDLHDLGIRTIRVGGGPLVESATPPATIDEPTTFDFTVMDQWVIPMVAVAPGGTPKPWTSIYLNPGGCPPWASEGQPAYVSELGITRWPPGSPETDASYCGGSWWNDRNNPGLGIHDFNQDPNRTDSVTLHPSDVQAVDGHGGRVITGPELAAIDAKMPARPYLANPPHRDPKYSYDLGYAVVSHYGGMVRLVGIENEPGGGLLARLEKRIGGDLMRDRMFPEIYLPFAKGVRAWSPNTTIAGCEADSAEILARFLDLDEERYRGRPSLSVCDKIHIHTYGSLAGGPSYATIEAFFEVLKGRQSYRDVAIGEIGGDPQELYEFTEMVVGKYPSISDIYYLNPQIFYEPGSSWSTAGPWDPKRSVVSPIGKKFATLFAKMNNPRRSA